MKKSFNFTHKYDKLDKDEFTTIRGRSAFWNYENGQEVNILLKGVPQFKAKIYHTKQMRIKTIPMELLIEDTKCGNFEIKDRKDFIKLINSFRRFHKIQSKEEFVSVFWLKKV